MRLPRDRALALLTQCIGDEIWSVDFCRGQRVPEAWIEELCDAFESGYQSDRQTIYVEDQQVNQYHGVRDVDLALKLAKSMGLDVDRVTATALGRQGIVRAIKEAVMDGD